jgi:hypothetical protein
VVHSLQRGARHLREYDKGGGCPLSFDIERLKKGIKATAAVLEARKKKAEERKVILPTFKPKPLETVRVVVDYDAPPPRARPRQVSARETQEIIALYSKYMGEAQAQSQQEKADFMARYEGLYELLALAEFKQRLKTYMKELGLLSFPFSSFSFTPREREDLALYTVNDIKTVCGWGLWPY